jgi:AraC-like DNA-binding protein
MRAFYEPRGEGERQFLLSAFHRLNFPLHLHGEYELLFVLGGKVSVTVGGETLEAGAGDAAVIMPDEIHGYRTAVSSRGILMIFPESYLPESGAALRGKTLQQHLLHVPDSGAEEFFRACGHAGAFREYLAAGFICSFFYRALSSAVLAEKRQEGGGLLRRVLLLIEREYAGPVNLNRAAENLGVSRTSVTRVLKAGTGCGFSEYVGLLRTEKAKRLLSQTELPVLDIALECGYDSGRSFGRAFRRFAGTSPSAFRYGAQTARQ